jgi:hypothetical protein
MAKPGRFAVTDCSSAPLHRLRHRQGFIGDHRLQRGTGTLLGGGDSGISFPDRASRTPGMLPTWLPDTGASVSGAYLLAASQTLALGPLLGLSQAAVLRGYTRRWAWWIAANIASWLIVDAVFYLLSRWFNPLDFTRNDGSVAQVYLMLIATTPLTGRMLLWVLAPSPARSQQRRDRHTRALHHFLIIGLDGSTGSLVTEDRIGQDDWVTLDPPSPDRQVAFDRGILLYVPVVICRLGVFFDLVSPVRHLECLLQQDHLAPAEGCSGTRPRRRQRQHVLVAPRLTTEEQRASAIRPSHVICAPAHS